MSYDQCEQERQDVDASIHFLARLSLYDTIKPYTLLYHPENGFPATNIESEEHRLKIQNMRVLGPCWDTNGFAFCSMASAMKYEDYENEDLVKSIHLPEVEACLRRVFRKSFVKIIDVAQRKRHASFPVATGEAYQHMQPTSRAHIDVTLNSAQASIRRALGAKSKRILAGQWQYVGYDTRLIIDSKLTHALHKSIWHPLRGPLWDWPLAVCDASSVDFEQDTMPADSVGIVDNYENTQVQYNANQRWYYLPGQCPSELLLFKHADSLSDKDASFGIKSNIHSCFEAKESKELLMRLSIILRSFITAPEFPAKV